MRSLPIYSPDPSASYAGRWDTTKALRRACIYDPTYNTPHTSLYTHIYTSRRADAAGVPLSANQRFLGEPRIPLLYLFLVGGTRGLHGATPFGDGAALRYDIGNSVADGCPSRRLSPCRRRGFWVLDGERSRIRPWSIVPVSSPPSPFYGVTAFPTRVIPPGSPFCESFLVGSFYNTRNLHTQKC